MSTESNKALARRIVEAVCNERNVSEWDKHMDKDFVLHYHGQDHKGLEASAWALASWQGFLGVAPDTRITIDEVVAEGDMVAVRAVLKGTNTGPIGNIPATGKKFNMAYVVFDRFRDGKIAECWQVMDRLVDRLGLNQQ